MLKNFKPSNLPNEYEFIKLRATLRGPNLMREALKNYGLTETPGTGNTREIIEMAEALGGVIEDFYTKDSIPWCGLALAYWIKQAGFTPPRNYSQVRARDYAKWGVAADTPSFGDVLVFWRGNKAGRDGHVGLYVMENAKYYYVLGANQADQVNIMKMKKSRLLAARRCPWRISQPKGVEPIKYALNTGKLSTNEA